MTAESLPETQRVRVRGIDVAYSDEGSGPVVLSAHGLSSSRENNRRMGLAEFREVAGSHRLISYDARGHGETEGTADEADYHWSNLAEDLLALADFFSPDAPVSAIGSSMGTGTVLHAVTSRPDRFDRLVLTAPPTAWQTRAAQASGYRSLADLIENGEPGAWQDLVARMPIPAIFQGLPGYPQPPAVAADLTPTVFRGAAGADLPPLDVIGERVTHPTLIIAWAGDPGHPVSTAEALHAAIDGSVLHVSETQGDLMTWGARAAEFLVA
ncbi:MAG: alpha/beta hydrolase [Microbacterium sp.]|uniref:alpha/beta fold hydrolase n=1 Tax=Microbacterium sp. TaxID=51671 RepID=UPI0026066750|nr:alpha/beta hydrolase [Microbacterium sp.]MCX6501507.1 alpha/beta hydrolase [Microbacterium sp.]